MEGIPDICFTWNQQSAFCSSVGCFWRGGKDTLLGDAVCVAPLAALSCCFCAGEKGASWDDAVGVDCVNMGVSIPEDSLTEVPKATNDAGDGLDKGKCLPFFPRLKGISGSSDPGDQMGSPDGPWGAQR